MATFFDTFNTGTIGSAPTGWTQRWRDPNITLQADGAARVARLSQAVAGRSRITLDAAGSFQNGEILARVRIDGTFATGSAAWLSAKIGGAATTETSVDVFILQDGNLVINRYIGGVSTELVRALHGINIAQYFWIRFQFNGTLARARVWEDGASEPGTWTVSVADMGSIATTSGFCGIGGVGIAPPNILYDYFAVADTAGEAAPPPPVAPAGRPATITLRNALGAPLANLTGLRWAFFDQTDPAALEAPVSRSSSGTTNASGVLTADITGSALAAGATGGMLVTSGDGLQAGFYTVALP